MKKVILALALLVAQVTIGQTLKDALKLTDNEQFYAATRMYKNLVQQQPTLGENYFYMGENYFKSEKLDSAQLAYKKELK